MAGQPTTSALIVLSREGRGVNPLAIVRDQTAAREFEEQFRLLASPAAHSPSGAAPRLKTQLTTVEDPRFRNRFWWGEYPSSPHSRQQIVGSTKQLARIAESGVTVTLLSGPHATRQAAHYKVDIAREAPGE